MNKMMEREGYGKEETAYDLKHTTSSYCIGTKTGFLVFTYNKIAILKNQQDILINISHFDLAKCFKTLNGMSVCRQMICNGQVSVLT